MTADYYNQMQQGGFQHPVYMSFTMPNFGFYQFQVRDGVRDAMGADLSDVHTMKGDWKFHMSVHPQDVPRAWDIVVEELLQQKHACLAKVVKPELAESFANPDNVQAGKHITIYTYKDLPPQLYMELMQNLESKLDAAGIRPGPQSNADRIISGGKYSSYRLESGPNGEYVGSVDLAHLPHEQRYNPWNTPDPYANFKMTTATNAFDIHPVIMDAKIWQDGITQGGTNITRIPVQGVNESTIKHIMDGLEKIGVKPTVHDSHSLGRTIRLTGDDVEKLRHVQKTGMIPAQSAPQIKDVFGQLASKLFGKEQPQSLNVGNRQKPCVSPNR